MHWEVSAFSVDFEYWEVHFAKVNICTGNFTLNLIERNLGRFFSSYWFLYSYETQVLRACKFELYVINALDLTSGT